MLGIGNGLEDSVNKLKLHPGEVLLDNLYHVNYEIAFPLNHKGCSALRFSSAQAVSITDMMYVCCLRVLEIS